MDKDKLLIKQEIDLANAKLPKPYEAWTIEVFANINTLTHTQASYLIVEAKEAGLIEEYDNTHWRGVSQ